MTTVPKFGRALSLAVVVGVADLISGSSGSALADDIAPGDAVRGQEVYERCAACHSPDVDRIGPHHRGVVGRKAGSVPGYDYSDGLRKSQIVWSARTLNRWLTDPQAFVPGAKMFFRVSDPTQRADVIAYLATLK